MSDNPKSVIVDAKAALNVTGNDLLKIVEFGRTITTASLGLFPDTVDEFKIWQKSFSAVAPHPKQYAFGDGKNKFYVFADTLERLVKDGCLPEVDLSLPKKELPELTGKSRNEIRETVASIVGGDHEKLLKLLEREGITHIVTPITSHIYVKECKWDTLVKLADFVKELNCDLTVSVVVEAKAALNVTGNDALKNVFPGKCIPTKSSSQFPRTVVGLKLWQKSLNSVAHHPKQYAFGDGKNKFYVFADTVERLVKDGCLPEVDLSLPKKELPDLKGKSRNEIREILVNRVGDDHAKLLKLLDREGITHIVTPITSHIYVKECKWDTLVKIADFVKELNCDLTVSGGATGKYLMDAIAIPIHSTSSEKYTKWYQNRIASSCLKYLPVRKVKIGVIDSGCSYALANSLKQNGKIVMPDRMCDATAANNPVYVSYNDCYVNTIAGIRYTGHGTAVVEIIAKSVVDGTEIHVANVGLSCHLSSVDCAMMELWNEGVNVMNFSLSVNPHGENLRDTMHICRSSEILMVGATSNEELRSPCPLNDGFTIMVGSHDMKEVPSFCPNQRRFDTCSFGSNIFIENVVPNFRSGTSYAVPNVTAAVANILSHTLTRQNESSLKHYLNESAESIKCCDGRHQPKLKFHPEQFVSGCLRECQTTIRSTQLINRSRQLLANAAEIVWKRLFPSLR